ncbi:hypothetical protein L7F22_018991 [Adiantum nelumboides]|nr:hypothetical protein [Adiantum nelumboides]
MDENEAIDIIAKDGTSIDRRQWRDLSAFDALDESWSAPEPSNSQKNVEEKKPSAQDLITAESESEDLHESVHDLEDVAEKGGSHTERQPLSKSGPIPTSSAITRLSPLRTSRRANNVFSKTLGTDLNWRNAQVTSDGKDDLTRRRRGKLRRRSSGAMTDTELLQPGPSSPSLRKPSHKLPSNQGIHMLIDTNASNRATSEPSSPSLSASLAFHDPLSPSRTARSSSTSSSGEKQGAHLSAQLQHLDLGPPLQAQRVAALRSADFHPQNSNPQNESLFGPDQFGSAREDISASQGAVTAEEATFIEHSNVASPPAFLKPAWAKKDQKGRARDIFAPLQLQTMFEPPSDTSRLAWRTSEEQEEQESPKPLQGTLDGRDESVDSVETDDVEKKEQIQHTTDATSPASPSKTEKEKEVTGTPDDAAVPAGIPQCTFTFSSPVVQPKRPPPTPSTSHAPLRLFHLKGRNSEIEQILNTPRSAAKSRDAKKMIWKLVEEEGRGDRESKRLRMDRIPDASALPEVQESEESVGAVNYVLEAPNLMNHIRAAGREENIPNRTISSSLVVNRRGASAPTPERARHPRRFGQNVSPLRRGESPRKLLRRWSAANQVDEEIIEEGNQSASDEVWQDIAKEDEPVRIPSTSSSITPMTRVPSVSIEPPASPDAYEQQDDVPNLPRNLASLGRSTDRPGMLHISPGAVPIQDMEAMSNGRMTFDRKMNRWIKTRQLQSNHGPNGKSSEIPEETTDPFNDSESFQTSIRQLPALQAGKYSFSTSKDSIKGSSSSDHLAPPSRSSPRSIASNNALLTPARNVKADPNLSVTPKSILKTAGASARWPINQVTPTISRQANRKISFADGINPQTTTNENDEKYDAVLVAINQLSKHLRQLDTDLKGDLSQRSPSLRLMDQDSFDDRQSLGMSDRFTTPRESKYGSFAAASMSVRSPWNLSMLRKSAKSNGDASFLTNASFNVAHDKMLQLLTDVAPWKAEWHSMFNIDLRGRRVDSLIRLDEFLPRLVEALLDDNEIEYLTGLPNTLRLLSISRNRLPSTAAFGHLENLETLDVSENNIDLRALRNLHQLKHLRANGNRIRTIQGIQNLEKLETLHLRSNALDELEIQSGQWPCLRDLVLSRNRLTQVIGLDNLVRLRSLNLDHNQLQEIDLGIKMPKLKQLRVSGNKHLSTLDVGPARNLRTLYADECSLKEVQNIGTLTKLDNLSLRQQNGDGELQWPVHDTRDVKRLFLSGNAFPAVTMSTTNARPSNMFNLSSSKGIAPFFGLVYLELSGCQLTSLPEDLAIMVPNLRQLNADYNPLENLPPMNRVSRLKRFSLIGCRIDRSSKLIESLEGCEELSLLDCRMNPCTLGLYPPIITALPRGTKLNRASLAPNPHPFISSSSADEKGNAIDQEALNEGMGSFAEKSIFHKRGPPPPDMMMGEESKAQIRIEEEEGEGKDDEPDTLFAASDLRFARTLPPNLKLQRLLHRGMLAMACANLNWLDGLLIDEEEVFRADEYLRKNQFVQREDARFRFEDQYQERDRADSIFSSNSE